MRADRNSSRRKQGNLSALAALTTMFIVSTLFLRIALSLWMVFTAPFAERGVNAQLSAPEYEVKAAFIFNILKFIEWPAATGDNTSLKFVVWGKDPFGSYLSNTFKDRLISGRAVEISNVVAATDIPKGDVVFISNAFAKDIDTLLPKLTPTTFTLSDADGLTEKGVIVNFVTKDSKIRFEINRKAAEKANVKISSKLLALAVRIVE